MKTALWLIGGVVAGFVVAAAYSSSQQTPTSGFIFGK